MAKYKVEENIVKKEVLQVLSSKYQRMFSAEKKIAEYVLKNPEKAVNCNVSELAKTSGVSDATVVRMCHHMGYTGYYQFRILLSRDLGKKSIEDSFTQSEGAVGRLFGEYAESMIAVGSRIDEDIVWKCVELLKNADMVHIIASGNTCNLSRYMGFRLERMGIRSIYDSLPEYYINHINLAGEKDIVVAITKSGTSKSVIRGMELAREKGLSTIGITASAQSPISQLADCLLLSSGKLEPFNVKKSYGYMNELAVIEGLLNFLTNEEKMKSLDPDKPEIVLSEYKV